MLPKLPWPFDEVTFLLQDHEGVADGGVAVRVVLHAITDDVGDLDEPTVVVLVERVQDAPLHGFQPVLQRGDGAVADHIARVREEIAVHQRPEGRIVRRRRVGLLAVGRNAGVVAVTVGWFRAVRGITAEERQRFVGVRRRDGRGAEQAVGGKRVAAAVGGGLAVAGGSFRRWLPTGSGSRRRRREERESPFYDSWKRRRRVRETRRTGGQTRRLTYPVNARFATIYLLVE